MGPPDHDAFPSLAGVDGVPPGEALIDVLAKMFDDDLDAVAVIEDGRLVGTCRRADIVHARRRQFAHERLEPGWRWRRGTVRP
jgi:CBS-domain-containing membrane protein